MMNDEVYESFSARCELTLIDDEKHNTILVSNANKCQITSFDLPSRRHPGFQCFSRNNGNKYKISAKCLWRVQILEFLQFGEEN